MPSRTPRKPGSTRRSGLTIQSVSAITAWPTGLRNGARMHLHHEAQQQRVREEAEDDVDQVAERAFEHRQLRRYIVARDRHASRAGSARSAHEEVMLPLRIRRPARARARRPPRRRRRSAWSTARVGQHLQAALGGAALRRHLRPQRGGLGLAALRKRNGAGERRLAQADAPSRHRNPGSRRRLARAPRGRRTRTRVRCRRRR